MAKSSNPNDKENSDAYPRGFHADKVRNMVDPEIGSVDQHNATLGKLDRQQGAEKGGR